MLGDRETAAGRKWPADLVKDEIWTRPNNGTYRKSVTFAAQDGCWGAGDSAGRRGETWTRRHLGKPGVADSSNL